MPLQVKEGQAILSQVKKRLSSVLTDMYSSTIYSKTQAFETFSLHFLENGIFAPIQGNINLQWYRNSTPAFFPL